MLHQPSLPTPTWVDEVVDALLAGHLQVVVAAKADVVVLLQVLDVQDDTTLVTPRPQALAAVNWLRGLACVLALKG
jgi:hypothetical protein